MHQSEYDVISVIPVCKIKLIDQLLDIPDHLFDLFTGLTKMIWLWLHCKENRVESSLRACLRQWSATSDVSATWIWDIQKNIQISILVSNIIHYLSVIPLNWPEGFFLINITKWKTVPFKPLLTENDRGEISSRNGNSYSTDQTLHNLVHVTPRQTPKADLLFAMCLLLVWFLKIWVRFMN